MFCLKWRDVLALLDCKQCYLCRKIKGQNRVMTIGERLDFASFNMPHLFTCLSSKLVINQIIPEDDAIYQCMAENSQGAILSRARLTVVLSEDRPSAPCNVHAETMSSSAILLAWERPLYNSDKVIAYSVHYMKAEGRRWPLDVAFHVDGLVLECWLSSGAVAS